MDHPNQNTMLLPASYAVISEEEMTYLDGGQSIYLGSAFNHDIYFNTDQFATFCQNAAINLFVLMTNYSFRYIAGRVQSGLSNGLSLSGTFYHTWDKMNTWSRIASVGVAGLAGVYVYSQVMNVIRTVTSIYSISGGGPLGDALDLFFSNLRLDDLFFSGGLISLSFTFVPMLLFNVVKTGFNFVVSAYDTIADLFHFSHEEREMVQYISDQQRREEEKEQAQPAPGPKPVF